MVLLVVYNPVCGSGLAEYFLEEHVLPILRHHNKTVDRIIATEYVGHAGAIIAESLKHHPLETTVILASGDGTLHEIVNQLSPQPEAVSAVPRISLVLVPMGTANALYSSLFPPTVPGDTTTVEYKLQSLHSYLNEGDPIPLTLCVTTLSPAHDARVAAKTAVSAVVTSTSLHASILHDSEALRKEMPGIERFKVAAQQNSKQWSNAALRLLPSSSRLVQIYDPASRAFVNHGESTEENPIVKLEGPFMYFISAVNVDRLEPEFRITPLVRTLPSRDATCDLVIVRPLRDPSIDADNEQARERYVDKIWKVMRSAYADGTHVNLRYDGMGEGTDEGDGIPVVEYVRCGGWEWIPDGEDERAHLLCSDGDILRIESGGRAISSATLPADGMGIVVHG